VIRLLVILMLANQLIARTNNQSSDRNRNFQILRHNVNRVEMCISNYGKFGQDETGNNPGCWWPRGCGYTYIYGAGIWFGTIDSLTGDTLVTIGYGPSGGESEFAPGLSGMSVGNPGAVIYVYPNHWPPPESVFPMAPQLNISHQDSWCCFNDSDSLYHIPGGRPIGIECYQTVYAWDLPILEDMIFFAPEVKNVSGEVLYDCYIGVCFDMTGLPGSGRCAGIVTKRYVMDGDTIWADDVGYQWEQGEPGTPPYKPGVISADLLQTPFDLQWGMDKDGDGIPDQYEQDSAYYVNNLPQNMWDADNDGLPDWRDPSQWPKLGITAFKRFTRFVQPNYDGEHYMTLAGYDFLTGVYEPFDTTASTPGDWAFVMSSGPFCLPPDSSVTLVFVVMFNLWWGIYNSPDSAMIEINHYAQDYYDMYWYLYTGIEENFELRNSDCQLRITPNPVVRSANIMFSLSTPDYVSLNLYNSVGQHVMKIMEGHRAACVHNIVIDTGMLAQGTYFLYLETSKNREYHTIVVLR
jgi:hypothetical protein